MPVSRRKSYWMLVSGVIALLLIGMTIFSGGSTEKSVNASFTDQPDLVRDDKTGLIHKEEINQYTGPLPETPAFYVSHFSPYAVENIDVPSLGKREGLIFLSPKQSFRIRFTDADDKDKIRVVMLNGYRFETTVNESTYCKSLKLEFYTEEEKIGDINVENTDRFENYTMNIRQKGFLERLRDSSTDRTIRLSLVDRKGCSFREQRLLIDRVELS